MSKRFSLTAEAPPQTLVSHASLRRAPTNPPSVDPPTYSAASLKRAPSSQAHENNAAVRRAPTGQYPELHVQPAELPVPRMSVTPPPSADAVLHRSPSSPSLSLFCPPPQPRRPSQQPPQPVVQEDPPSPRGRTVVREVSERLYPRKYTMGRSHSPTGRGFKPWHYGPRYCGFPPVPPVPKHKKPKDEIFYLDGPSRPPPETMTVFVIGGPGSGKGTQCAEMVKNYGFFHISAGELLRNEIECRTDVGIQCERLVAQGELVPSEITLRLLKDAIIYSQEKYVLIDGFPRSLDQVEAFEKEVGKPDLVLYLECPQDVMQQRLLKRGLTSKRSDDNMETIQKRFETFQAQSGPVLAHYQEYPNSYMLETIATGLSPFDVFQDIAKLFEVRFALNQKEVDHSQHNCKFRVTIFVLGVPGSGKGTQCVRMIKEFGYTRLSIDELLRAEIKSGSDLGKECNSVMGEGKQVPDEITINVLNKAMEKAKCKRFLIDGFPRSIEQALAYEEKFGRPNLVLCFDCTLELMQKRLLDRARNCGREEDDVETINQRFEAFMAETQPVVEYYKETQPRVVRMIPTDKLPQDVYADVRCALRSTVEKA